MSKNQASLFSFWQPRYWLVWVGIGVLRLVVLLPQSKRMLFGRFLGRRMFFLLKNRRQIAITNLQICFPKIPLLERQDLAKRHFESLGMGIIELGMAWWCSDEELNSLINAEGTEYLNNALKQGSGVILLSAHFSCTELVTRKLALLSKRFAAMYRPSNNQFTDEIIYRIRSRSFSKLIEKDNVRKLIKTLNENTTVWYASDQAHGRRGNLVANFFEEPAITNTAISQIAKISNAPVIPFFPVRIENGCSYKYEILPPLKDFPSGDLQADAERLNQLLEKRISIAPEQYYWVHRRFKNRPDGFQDP
ncbi:MAG: lipid A biosynthesis lauroyl acyltransferase, partial [Pseudomonadota bacterium]|nr:lipid A biosynthesis lauroyl acyltransferase [Pseudomonadota bacterium]